MSRITIVLLAFLVAGCVNHEIKDYFGPELVFPESGCSSLSGVFDNKDLNEAGAPLTRWLIQTGNKLENVARVRFAGPNAGILKVSFIDTVGKEIYQRDFKEGDDYQCEDGWLDLQQPKFKLVGTSDDHIARMTRARDGSLVVQDREVGKGVVIFVPIYASSRYWHRYRLSAD